MLTPLEEKIKHTRLIVFDFDGVFTDNAVYVTQDGTESVRCWRGDGIGIGYLRQCGVTAWVLSTETNPVVTARCQKLQLPCIQGSTDKYTGLLQISQHVGIPLTETAFMGNDVNDIPALQVVSFPIVVQDAHPDVIPYALYRTRTPGGYGAVREIGELFKRIVQA
jgi:YrbI family 3-deoxy-D-manno-octulosonate 8-phosphate phosphatase